MASIRTRRRRDGSRAFQVREIGVQSRTFARHADAKRYKIEVERAKALGALYEAPPESFGAFLQAWIERKEAAGRRASTVRSMRETAHRLEPISRVPIPELRMRDVEDLLSAIAGDAPRRAQMATTMVKAVLRSAQERGQRVDERLFTLRRPRYEEREPRFLTLAQMFAIATWMPESMRRIVPVAGLTGMRQGELLALEDRDVDVMAKRLLVRRGKTKAAQRQVPLADELVTLLREQLLARANGTPLVFPTPTGLPWDRNRFMHRVFRPAVRAAAIAELGGEETGSTSFGRVELAAGEQKLVAGVRFHDLRHSAVSIMALAGWRFEHVAQQVGWEPGSWPVMWARYRHLLDGEIEHETAKLDALVRAWTSDGQTAGGQ